MTRSLLVASVALTLAACGGGSDNSSDTDDQPVFNPSAPEAPVVPVPEEGFAPEAKGISDITLVDAYGSPLANANVTISPLSTVATSSLRALSSSIVVVTDSEGNLVTSDLEPGTYSILVSIGTVSVTFTLVVGEDNAGDSMSIIAPLVISEDVDGGVVAVDLSGEGLFVSLSGTVFDADGPVADAQLSISGGDETNGAVATGFSDAEGNYTLTFNVALAKLAAISEGRIRVHAEGYLPYVATVSDELEINGTSAFSGLNFELIPREDEITVFYSEDFEQSVDGSCGSWTEYVLQESDYSEEPEEWAGPGVGAAAVAVAPVADDTLWNSHTAGEGIINQAFLDGLVVMAPNDSSEGAVPDPESNIACWYGDDVTGTATTGNFMGEADENPQDSLNGGDSLTYNAGAIVSPEIDLTNIEGSVSLSFDTWWEIESVNPNENGFDLMTVEYNLGDGEGWQTLIRLNPLTDPVTEPVADPGIEDEYVVAAAEPFDEVFDEQYHSRASLPYSNTGFNRAPRWIAHEPVPLDTLVGNFVTLRFVFRTQDGLYNGFRGWMLDNIRITDEVGSFPISDSTYLPGPPYDGITEPEPEPETFSVTANYTPNPDFSLNEGSTRTFTADVSWAGGDQVVGSIKLQVFRNELLIEEVTVTDEVFLGKSTSLSVDAYVGNSSDYVEVTLTVFDDEGEVIYSEQHYHSVAAV